MSASSSPLDEVPSGSAAAPWVAGAGALAAHAAVVVCAAFLAAGVVHQVKPTAISQLVEIDAPAEPPPAPPPATAMQPPDSSGPAAHAPDSHRPPPPAAAQASQVLTAPADVVDFGDAFVTGKGTAYAGGVTEANGTSTSAVRDTHARAGGVPGGLGSVASPPSRARPAQLVGGSSWDCPFPVEADDAGLDHAVVTLSVQVSEAGAVAGVRADRDPGHGFAREAKRCALRKHWAPGLDRDGNAVSSTSVVNVRFDR